MAEAIFDRIKTVHDYNFQLKDKQILILDHLLNKENVFAILPTSYGKRVLFSTFPLLKNEVSSGSKKLNF